MNTIKIEKKQVLMVAHQGLSGLETGNTNAAFIAAGNRSYYGIETDVHKTADGKYVVIHDENTLRVSNGAFDVNVEESAYEVVEKVVLPDIDGSATRRDIKIPLLEEYVQICKKYEKKCVLELKNHFCKEDIAEIIEIIKKAGYLQNVIFISFDLENCTTLRDMLPSQPVQWLSETIDDEIFDKLCRYSLDLDVNYKSLTKKWIEKLHEKNITINCYTCNDKNEAEELVKMGVDCITSNILE